MKLYEVSDPFMRDLKRAHRGEKLYRSGIGSRPQNEYSPTFLKMLADQDYREDVLRVVESWPTEKIRRAIARLRPEQIEEPEAHERMVNNTSRITMIEYLVSTIWSWGWEGSEHFLKRHQ